MKKYLLTGALITITATTLYATTAGSTVVDAMKAAAHSFTLATSLNPGQTGLQSAPLSGKKAGDMLTAEEYNRMLELLASSGVGITDIEVITSQDVGAAAGTSYANRWSEANCPVGKKIITGGCAYPNTRNSFIHNAPKNDLSGWTCGAVAYNGDIASNSPEYPTRPTATAVCGVYGGSVSGTGGSGWENVPLTDTVDFDTSCLYRFQTGGNAYPTFMGNSPYYIVNAVSPTQLTWWLDMGGSDIRHISSSSKTKYRINGAEYAASGGITKIEKFCGGGGGAGGSGLSLYKCTNAQSLDATNAPCYGASRNGGAGTNQYRVVSCTDNDGVRSYTMSSILNFGQLVVNKWAVSVNGGTIECDDGTVLVMDIQGGGAGAVATGASVISCKKKNSTYSTSTVTGQPLVKFTASDCGGTLPDASYNGAIGSLNVCNGAIDHTVYSGGTVNGPGVSFSFRGGYACTWPDGNGYDISVIYMK